MPLQSSPRRLTISLLLSALLLSSSFESVLACHFKATPEKVAPGNGCQVHWDQTKPGNSGGGNRPNDTPGKGDTPKPTYQPNTQNKPSTDFTKPGGSTGPNTGPTGGNNPSTGGPKPSTGYTPPTNTGTGTYTRPTVGTNTQSRPNNPHTKPAYSKPDSGYSFSKPDYSQGTGTYTTPDYTKPSTGTNTATTDNNNNHNWNGYSRPVYGGAQSKPAYGPGGTSTSMPIYNSHTAQNQGASQAISNLGPATTNINNQNTNINNQQNQNSNTNVNNNSNNVNINTDYTEWKSTTVSLMTGVQGSGQLVAQIAINVDMSAETGTYNIPQAPYLTCYGQSYYYKLVSSSNSVFFTDTFEISESSSGSSTGGTNTNSTGTVNNFNPSAKPMGGPNNSTVSKLPTNSTMPKLPTDKMQIQADTQNSEICKDVKVKEHDGYSWGAINNFVYGYTIVQNITNIYNNVVTTVVEGQKTTTTVLSTVTKQATVPATTVTQSGGVIPSQATTSITSYSTITQTSVKTITPTGGADVKPITTTVTSYTVSHSGPPPPPQKVTETSVTTATAPGTTAPPVTITQSGTTTTLPGSSIPASSGPAEPAEPTTAPAPSESKCTEDDWDESCEEWAEEPSGVSSSAQAGATGGANIDDLYGKAVGSPQVSYAVAVFTALTAILGGSALLLL